MKKLISFLPHLCIACALTLVTVNIFNGFNPRMGFLQGTPYLVLVICSAVVSILTAFLAIAKKGKYQSR